MTTIWISEWHDPGDALRIFMRLALLGALYTRRLCSCKGHGFVFGVYSALARRHSSRTGLGRTVTHLPHVFVAVVFEVQLVGCYNFIASAIIIIWICWAQNKGNQGHCDIMVMSWWPKWRKGSSSVMRHSYIRHLHLKSNRFFVSTSRTAFDPTLSPHCIHSAGQLH